MGADLDYADSTKNTLVRLSDYKKWFLTQPTVGEAIVYGSYEYYKLTGILNVTGLTYVVLYSKSGKHFTAEDYNNFDDAIADVKDSSVLSYQDFEEIWHYYEIRYVSSLNDSLFYSNVLKAIQDLYTDDIAIGLGLSLFGAFDTTKIGERIDQVTYKPVSLSIIPYIVTRNEFMKLNTLPSGSDPWTWQLDTPSNLKEGYTIYQFNPKDGIGMEIDTVSISGGVINSVSLVDNNGGLVGSGSGYWEVPENIFI